MSNRRAIFFEPFLGLAELVEKLALAADYARMNGQGEPAIEARQLPVDRQLRPRVELYEETLSDKSTQLVAVVIA